MNLIFRQFEMILDKLDAKILSILDTDARRSISLVARQVKRGRDTVEYRLQRLVDQGVIKGCAAVVNPYRLGFTLFKTYLRLKFDDQRMAALLGWLAQQENVFCVCRCEGSWDLLFNCRAKSIFEFNSIQSEMLTLFSDMVIEFDFAVILSQQLLSRTFGTFMTKEKLSIGGYEEAMVLDKLEFEILRELGKNARIKIAKLARKLDSTPSIIQTRIDKLIESRVIVGSRILPELSELGITPYKVQLCLREFREPLINSMVNQVSLIPEATKVIRQLGSCKLEITFECETALRLQEIISLLRKDFSEMIASINTLILTSEYYYWNKISH